MRRLVTVVSVGALTFAVYLATGGTVPEQVAYLADGGFAPNRDATCPVRLDPDFAADAGLSIYQRLKFPVALTVLAALTTGAKWGTAQPFTLAGVVKPWCRAKVDAGLPCVLLDGGDPGNRNVGLCAGRALPATCERVSSGVIYAGDNPEDL